MFLLPFCIIIDHENCNIFVGKVAQALVAGADQTDKMVTLDLLPVIQPFIFRVWKIRLVFQLYESPNSGEKIVEVMWNNIMSNNK